MFMVFVHHGYVRKQNQFPGNLGRRVQGVTAMNSQICICDVDETLFGFNNALRECAVSHGYRFPTMKECTHWEAIYDFIPKDEAIKLFDEVHEHQCDYAPFPDAKDFLNFMNKHFDVIIASHRKKEFFPELQKWMVKNHLMYDQIDVSFDKTKLFSLSRVKVVIDDRDETLRIAMDAGLTALGLRRPWNENANDRNYLLFETLTDIQAYIETNVIGKGETVMYYKGKDDKTGRLIELMHLQQDLRYLGYENLGLPSFQSLRDEVEEEIEMLKKGDTSHV
jgi:hypothetical protein